MLMLTTKTNNYVLKNTKIVLYLRSQLTVQSAYFGIFQGSSTWEVGKLDSQEKVKNMDKVLRSFLINTFTKANF